MVVSMTTSTSFKDMVLTKCKNTGGVVSSSDWEGRTCKSHDGKINYFPYSVAKLLLHFPRCFKNEPINLWLAFSKVDDMGRSSELFGIICNCWLIIGL